MSDIHARIVAARELGTAVLLVSEDVDELLELADRIAVISNGVIVHVTQAQARDGALWSVRVLNGPPKCHSAAAMDGDLRCAVACSNA
ncbi:MAG: transporter ATP-binding protein [Ramlibacter sp.]|nr:transporter ATP-binding protein [Ramlibacter sp.]